MDADTAKQGTDLVESVTLLYHPVLQESFRQSIKGALRSALQLVETKLVLKSLYFSLNEKQLPEKLENEILNNQNRHQRNPHFEGRQQEDPQFHAT